MHHVSSLEMVGALIYNDFSDVYDQQYVAYQDDVAFYRRVVEDYGDPILELGAGTARLSIALARRGFRMVGIELSEAMLGRGRKNLVEAGLGELVELRQGDMRTLDLGARFPVVLAPFNTLMHAYTLQDQDRTLAAVLHHLEPGGVFAFDLFMPHFGALGVLRQEREWSHVGGGKSELFILQLDDPDKQLIETRYYLDTTQPDGALTRRRSSLVQRYYTRFEIERALYQAGFANVRLFGGFDKQPFRGQPAILVGIARA
ncbi:MAG: methyltransferase domain-containing protein [Trueperaceae bacterium]|nr:MAG: methyltransferase domain-containing protein [Trueperaceae bacterium]